MSGMANAASPMAGLGLRHHGNEQSSSTTQYYRQEWWQLLSNEPLRLIMMVMQVPIPKNKKNRVPMLVPIAVRE